MGAVFSFPTIGAIHYAFKPIYDATVEFETSNEPSLFWVLPMMQIHMCELSRVELVDTVVRDEGRSVRPSL